MRVLTVQETAKRLGISPQSLYSKPYRIRLGLPATKIGERLCFIEADIDKLIERGRERLPGESRKRVGSEVPQEAEAGGE